MPSTKIKDAVVITPKGTYRIPVGNTEFNDARTITLQELKQWMSDTGTGGGGGWSFTELTNVPAIVIATNLKTVNGESLLGGGNLDVEANTIQWENVVNKPTIPTKTSELENDAEFVPLETLIAEFQKKLVSGVNLATVNGYDLLSGGNIVIPSRERRVEVTPQSGSVTISFEPNTLYVFNGEEIVEFTFTLVPPDNSFNYVNTYHFIFRTGTNAVINWDASVIAFTGGTAPTLSDNTWYEVKIKEGLAEIIKY